MINRLQDLIDKSRHSNFFLWLLNLLAARIVPFNKAHSFEIKNIERGSAEIWLPYKRSNLNHIKGIHACALATLCEYNTGLVLLSALDAARYRIILKNINVTYHYQAKKDVHAKFSLSQDWIRNNILSPLDENESVFTELQIEVYDSEKKHICTGLITWQVKDWQKVKLKV